MSAWGLGRDAITRGYYREAIPGEYEAVTDHDGALQTAIGRVIQWIPTDVVPLP
jgi:hypothetical protein